MTDAKRRFDFDYVRAIAIILILFGHSELDSTVVKYIYSFHIPLFFFISGGGIMLY